MLHINRLILALILISPLILLTSCGSGSDRNADAGAEATSAVSSRTGTDYTDSLAEQLDTAAKTAAELEAAAKAQAEQTQRAIDEAAGQR